MFTGVALLVALSTPAAQPCTRTPLPASLRGITMVHVDDLADQDAANDGKRGYGTNASRAMIKQLRGLNLDVVSLVTVATLSNKKDTSIQTHFSSRGHPTGSALIKTMQDTHDAGMRVMVVPHLQIQDGSWRGDITMVDRVQADAFFSSLTAYVTHVATLAEQGCADIFSISLELKGLSGRPEHRTHWLALIASVRRVYKGTLTYSANWDEAANVVFWDALDVVGINGFWPLQHHVGATPADLKTGALAVTRDLATLHARVHKRILLTEFGFRSQTDSALKPWEWPQPTADDTRPSDEAFQASAYDALLCALQPQPWSAGAVAWMTPSDPRDQDSPNRWEGPHGFSPLGKQAQDVLKTHCR